jgi:mandelate racemase
MQNHERLTVESIEVRAVSIPMRRPIVSKVGGYPEWPFILIDVKTKEGIIGRSYLECYLKDAVRYVGPAILDLAEAFKGSLAAPLDLHRKSMDKLHLLGRQGVTLIAAAGIDMAMWDILAKAAGLPLANLLGGSIGGVRAYNTNGLWLIPLDRLKREAEELVGEGGFSAVKIRLGRENLRDDLEAIKLVRQRGLLEGGRGSRDRRDQPLFPQGRRGSARFRQRKSCRREISLFEVGMMS